MDINGKVAVVTGGASGIGQAVSRRIAAAGGKVVVFDLNEEAGQAMVAELGADNCVFANVNVVDEASAKAGIDAAVAAFWHDPCQRQLRGDWQCRENTGS